MYYDYGPPYVCNFIHMHNDHGLGLQLVHLLPTTTSEEPLLNESTSEDQHEDSVEFGKQNSEGS